MADQHVAPFNPEAALYKKAIELGMLGPLSEEIPFEVDDQAYIVQLFIDALVVPVGQWDQVQRLPDEEGEA